MGVMVGSGEFRYEVTRAGGSCPDGWTFKEVGGGRAWTRRIKSIALRAERIRSSFSTATELPALLGRRRIQAGPRRHMAPDDTIYLTDDGDHTVRKCTLGRQSSADLGVPGQAGALS